jgi:hypothetical protein
LLFAVLVTMTLTAGSTGSDSVTDSLDAGGGTDVARSEGATVDVGSTELFDLGSELVVSVATTVGVAAASSVAAIELTVEISDAEVEDSTALELEDSVSESLEELTKALTAGSAPTVGAAASLELAELVDDCLMAEDDSRTLSSEVAEAELSDETSIAVVFTALALVCVVVPSDLAVEVVLATVWLSLSSWLIALRLTMGTLGVWMAITSPVTICSLAMVDVPLFLWASVSVMVLVLVDVTVVVVNSSSELSEADEATDVVMAALRAGAFVIDPLWVDVWGRSSVVEVEVAAIRAETSVSGSVVASSEAADSAWVVSMPSLFLVVELFAGSWETEEDGWAISVKLSAASPSTESTGVFCLKLTESRKLSTSK